MASAENNNKKTSAYPHVEAYERKLATSLERIKRYVYQEPAIVLTALYLTVSVIGLAYLIQLFDRLNISVLPHVEITDFVLSAVRYPKTIAVFLAFVLLLLVIHFVEGFFRTRWMFYRRQLNKQNKSISFIHPLALYSIVFLVYLVIAAKKQAVDTVETLERGEQTQYTVQLDSPIYVNEKFIAELSQVQVIANLSKHLWLYHQPSKQIFMIGHENIIFITPYIKTLTTDNNGGNTSKNNSNSPVESAKKEEKNAH